MLLQKLSKALELYRDAVKKLTRYSEYVGPNKQKEYEVLERRALEEGGDALNIYTVSSQPCESRPLHPMDI
jgi:hypothetical protein